MEYFNNIQAFADNYPDSKLDDNISNLILFTTYSNLKRNIASYSPLSKNITKNNDSKWNYNFNYNNKSYSFSVFSDYNLQEFDKKLLVSSKRLKYQLSRALKLACSMDLVNPRVSIGNSKLGTFDSIIIFEGNGTHIVIDYGRNLVMKKNDYFELFSYKEINCVDKYDLYNIFYMINKLDNPEDIYEYLIFTKEIFNELSKRPQFSFLIKKYDYNGFNLRNYTLMGNDHDCLFFQTEDNHMKYETLVSELDSFTENPQIKAKHITYDKKTQKYKLKEKNFGFFTFDLLSDLICDEQIKQKLLSDSRYGECHDNSLMIANSFTETDKKNIYVVSGKFKTNEIDYFDHSWVEIDNKNVVIDFNHNIVMNRDKYYKLFEIKTLNKTLINEMEEIINTVIFGAKLEIDPSIINLFGKELMNDLKRNEKVLQ